MPSSARKLAVPIEIDAIASLPQVSFMSPPWDKLVDACGSVATFKALGTSTDDTGVKVQGMVCIPPLIAESVTNAASKKPADLTLAFMAAMAAHGGIMDKKQYWGYINGAMAHIQFTVQFC
jgi:hypothetical protein